MKKSLITVAYNIACKKLDLHPEYDYYLHYSFIVQDNKIIEWGTNNKIIPAVHFGYQARLNDDNFKPKMHSEWIAYRRAKGLLDRRKPFDLINIRLNRKKEIKMSKPCDCCFTIIKEIGCRKIYYSNENGFFKV